MTTEILYSWGPGENRLALLRDGRLAELVLDRPHLLAGSVILGRVAEVLPKQGWVFVDIGQDRPGFLQGVKGLTQGAALPVLVKADAHGEKGATLSTEIVLAGRFVNFIPGRPGISVPRKLSDDKQAWLHTTLDSLAQPGEGITARQHAATAQGDDLADDIAWLRRAWADIQTRIPQAKAPSLLWRADPVIRMLADNPGTSRIIVDDSHLLAGLRPRLGDLVQPHGGPDDLFTLHDVDDAIAAALSPLVSLACGGRISIEQTRALTAIDVDSGPAPALEANTQAVSAIARQLRLRNIGGQMVVDFVSGGGKGVLLKLISQLKQAVSRDPIPTHVLGTSALGLVEMTRERKGPSLAEQTCESESRLTADAVGLEGLRRLIRESRHRPGRALVLDVSPATAQALARNPHAMAQAGERLGRPVTIRPVDGAAHGHIAIGEPAV